MEKLTTKLHVRSFEMALLANIVLGDQDGNEGNYLFSLNADDGLYHVHTIDHERIMPPNNSSINKTVK